MDYIVPAWHQLLNDWSFTVPHLEFDDATNQLQLFQSGKTGIGLLVTDYQPYLITKLGQLALSPQRVLSVFDYLQGINHLDGHTVSYRDLRWPADAFMEFGNFHLIVRQQNRRYAEVVYDTQGRIIWVDYYGDHDRVQRRLRFDSRGFVSRAAIYHGKTVAQHIYYDEQGHWRFKHDLATDAVMINPTYQGKLAHQCYDHLNDLIAEVVFQNFLPKLRKTHGRLVISVDNQATVDQRKLGKQLPTIYSVSHWHAYDQVLPRLDKNLSRLVVDSQATGEQVTKLLPDQEVSPVLIPPFYSQFQLGHSQQVREQRLALFAENIDLATLSHLLELLYKRLFKRAKQEQLYIFTYSQISDASAKQALRQLCDRHQGEFLLYTKQLAQMLRLRDQKFLKLPILHIKVVRLASVADALKYLDKIRVIIDWSPVPDEFFQMISVSMGIPQIQRQSTAEVQDHQNGLICQKMSQLNSALDYYLKNLRNWNVALINDVRVLNRNSSQQLLAKWRQAWKQGEY